MSSSPARVPPLWRPWLEAVREAFADRRAYEARLAASEERLKAAAESIPDGLAIFDAEDRFVFVNSRYPEHITPALAERLRLGVRFGDWLREGLADMLITDLSRSTKLLVLNRQQLHLLLGRSGHKQGEKIQLDEALDVARNSRAEAVILGNFAKLGERVRIDVHLHDARSGQLLAAETMNADRPEQILTQVDLLALKLAAHLGAAPNEQEKAGLTEVMTDNLGAYRYYSLALEKVQGLHNTEAISLLKKAVALDPQFAMAYARIGYAYALTWAFADKGKPYLEKAFQLSHRLTERDKLNITAWYAVANLDYPRAIEAFRHIIARYPLELEAYERLGRLLEGEERPEEAVEVLKQGLVIDHEAEDIYNMLGRIYSHSGRHDEAIRMHQHYVALAPDEPNAHDSLGLSYQWAGQYEQARAEYERALALSP
jgi:tetratricopeptide (TPR) repeat protein